jgi:hypothetical protein
MPTKCTGCRRSTEYNPKKKGGGRDELAPYSFIPMADVYLGNRAEWMATHPEWVQEPGAYFPTCDDCRAAGRVLNSSNYAKNLEQKHECKESNTPWCRCKSRKEKVKYTLLNEEGVHYSVCDLCVVKGRKQRDLIASANELFQRLGIPLKACRHADRANL